MHPPFRAPSSLALSILLLLGGCGGSSKSTSNVDQGAPPEKMLSLLAGALGGPDSVDDRGTAARFGGPEGMAFDGAGNLFIVDSGNDTIRKIDPSGMVTTLAGSAGQSGTEDGTGAAARFRAPQGIAVDSGGTVLYVADSGNHTIRKIVIASAEVTTVAGTGGQPGPLNGNGTGDGTGIAARFYYPYGVALDSAGKHLYVTDGDNHTIREVDLTTRGVTTLAGTVGKSGADDGTGAAARFNVPGGLALDAAGKYLYVADILNNQIRRVDLASNVVSTMSGPGTSTVDGGSADGGGTAPTPNFNRPFALALNGAGKLFVADTFHHAIREVDFNAGTITPLVGAEGQMGSADGSGDAARFGEPEGIVVDSQGKLWVADTANYTIRKVDPGTREVTTVAGTASQTGSTDGTGADARFDAPYAVASDNAGHLYIADANNHTVRQIVIATGEVTTIAGSAGNPRPSTDAGTEDGTGADARFFAPYGIAVDGAGHLFVADTLHHTVRQIVVASGEVTTLAGLADMAGPSGGSGTGDGTGTDARFNSPQGVATDGAGHVYVADTGNNTIRMVDVASRAVTTLAGTAGEMPAGTDGVGADARFKSPEGIVADGVGNLYVADTVNQTIRKIVIASQEVSTVAGTAGMPGSTDGIGSAARFKGPRGIVFDGAGNLFIADELNFTIRKMDLASGAVSTFAGVPGSRGVGLGALPARLNYTLAVAVAASEVFVLSENAVLSIH